MLHSNLLYATLLTAAAFLSILVSGVAWRRRRTVAGACSLAALMVGVAWWEATYALHWAPGWRPSPTFWIDLSYVGAVGSPLAFFHFALHFTNRGRWISPRTLALLSIEPVLALFLLWTNSLHGWFLGSDRPLDASAIFAGTIFFWINVLYLYGLMVVACWLLLQRFLRAPRLYRGQTGTVLLSALIPWGLNIGGIFLLGKDAPLDPTPFAFTLTGILLALSLFSYRLLDIVPTARDVLVESMSDGVLVLDRRNRLLDVNASALSLLGYQGEPAIGAAVQNLLTRAPHFLSPQDDQEAESTFIQNGRYLEVRTTALKDATGATTGRLLVLRDVTERKQTELRLQAVNQRLQDQIEEIAALQQQLREQAAHDPLTGLFNRRYLDEHLSALLHQARETSTPVSVVILDLDHFKAVNDDGGHAAGDALLQMLADHLGKALGEGEWACRYGGDEFVMVLPGCALGEAKRRIDTLREQLRQDASAHPFALSFSAGVAECPTHADRADALLQAADQALYAAKRAGRNQIGSPVSFGQAIVNVDNQ